MPQWDRRRPRQALFWRVSRRSRYPRPLRTRARAGVLTGLICEALETLASASNVEDLTVAALFEEMTASEHYASWRLFSIVVLGMGRLNLRESRVSVFFHLRQLSFLPTPPTPHFFFPFRVLTQSTTTCSLAFSLRPQVFFFEPPRSCAPPGGLAKLRRCRRRWRSAGGRSARAGAGRGAGRAPRAAADQAPRPSRRREKKKKPRLT